MIRNVGFDDYRPEYVDTDMLEYIAEFRIANVYQSRVQRIGVRIFLTSLHFPQSFEKLVR